MIGVVVAFWNTILAARALRAHDVNGALQDVVVALIWLTVALFFHIVWPRKDKP